VTRAPSSTYRLQIRPELTLDDAADLVDYLVDLGVGAVYLSPILTSTTGSDHGYDVTDPTRIDPARGGEDGWTHLVGAARAAGLPVVVDIVPNHLGISIPAENPAWWSVLEHGAGSPYASWFDIDWTRAPILVPILGPDAGPDDLSITGDATQGYRLHYYEHEFPLAPGTYSPGDPLAEVLERQHYRLASYTTANTDINYRRFFAVTTLAGLRVEDVEVYRATHERVLAWVRDGQVNGLRIDHPDGLVDPVEYLERLRADAPEAWIIVEKILEHGEELPDWPVEGTSGYDAMTEVNQVFVDPAAEQELTALYRKLTGDERSIEEHIVAGKQMAATELLISEARRLVRLAGETLPELDEADAHDALVETAAHLEVYRSYLPVGAERLDTALAAAGAADPSLGDALEALSPRLYDPEDELARRFQQFSGAVMAKGVEDTAYYRYSRFIALNEVGGHPAQVGTEPAEFHAQQARRLETAAESMTSLSTHDTKRGEDVRARLAVLAELGEPWRRFATTFVEGSGIESKPFAYLLAQTFAGAGMIERDRMHAYAEKAMREANDGTGWADENADFEAAVHACVDAWYDDPGLQRAWADLLEQIEAPGWSNSLGAKLVQLTMPGVPDVYQGTELWDDSLVDPDNRRPVDVELRRLLAAAPTRPAVDASGAAKLWVTRTALRLRRDRPELFTSYTPVQAEGAQAHHALAFDRGGALTVATRLPVQLAESGWGDTVLPLDGTWRDELTGTQHTGQVALAELLATYPVALLTRA